MYAKQNDTKRKIPQISVKKNFKAELLLQTRAGNSLICSFRSNKKWAMWANRSGRSPKMSDYANHSGRSIFRKKRRIRSENRWANSQPCAKPLQMCFYFNSTVLIMFKLKVLHTTLTHHSHNTQTTLTNYSHTTHTTLTQHRHDTHKTLAYHTHNTHTILTQH